MAKCKICEENISEDKLGAHSSKCKEVEEAKVELVLIRNKMQSYEERANLMKNSLETNAARQRRFHQKKPSRGTGTVDLNSPGVKTGTKDTFSAHCASTMGGNEGDLNNSEDDIGTPSMTSRGFTIESAEPIRKMSLEEYNKFIEEVKKSIFALKKVMGFANKVIEKYLALGQLDDPDRIAQNEIEIIYEQIVDSKVSEFIHDFKQDLADYVEKKAKYMANRNKLIQIGGYDKVIEDVKEKFKATKSASYRRNGVIFNKLPVAPAKFKEDDGLAKEHSKSPGTSKKKAVAVKGGAEFASPFNAKRTLNRQIGASGPLQSPLLAALSGVPSKSNLTSLITPKGQKPELTRIFLQNNSNHIGASLFKKKEDDGISTRDKIKNVVVHKIDLIEKSEAKIRSPLISSSVASSPRAGASPKIMVNNLVNSPALSLLLSPHLSKLAQYKDAASQRKSRFSTNASFFGSFKGNADTPTRDPKAEAQKNFTAAANAVAEQTPAKAKKRSVSMDLLKALHNEEKKVSQFPSLLLSGVSTVASPPYNASNPSSPKNFFSDSPEKNKQKGKKKRVEECVDSWESPSMKGYYSDNNQKSTKSQLQSTEINQVSLKDFKFVKFLGKGAYGTVWLVEKIATGDHYALKLVETANSVFTQNREMALKLEKDIYEVLDGDFVVKAVWTFRHEDYICFVTEYMVGGDFNKLIEKVGRLDHDQAQFYFAELVLAVESLHNMGIVHRDLKPDNILLDAKGHLRLTDFGLSELGLNILRGNGTPSGRRSVKGSPVQGLVETASQKSLALMDKLKHLTLKGEKNDVKLKSSSKKKGEAIFNFLEKDSTLLDVKAGKLKQQQNKEPSPSHEKKVRIVGTPDYMAPEIVNFEKANTHSLNDKCLDFWSLGAILYEFCVGVPPFNDETREAIFDNIVNLRITWPDIGYEEDSITPETQDLIKQLLNPDPRKRLGAEGVQQIKNHAFFRNFNWEGIREREAPIIPCLLEESVDTEESSKTKDEEPVKHPFSDAEGKKPKKYEQTSNQSEVDFRMVKIKVLHQMNQDYVKKLEKQKSVSSKIC